MNRLLLICFLGIGLLWTHVLQAQLSPSAHLQIQSTALDSAGIAPYVDGNWHLMAPDTNAVTLENYDPHTNCFRGRGLIHLTLDADKKPIYLDGVRLNPDTLYFDITATVDIRVIDRDNTVHVFSNQVLEIRYDNRDGRQHRDRAYFISPDTINVKTIIYQITHLEVSYNGGVYHFPNNIRFQSEVHYSQFALCNSDPIGIPDVGTQYVSTDYPELDGATKQLNVHWGSVEEATAYQLEWTFVPRVGHLKSNQFSFKNNGTRITTTATSYQIPLHYEEGYVVYRVRAIGWCGTCDQPVMKEGAWTVGDEEILTVDDYFGQQLQPADYDSIRCHEDLLNWKFQVDFAEEGKNKVSLSYADAYGLSRQSVVRNNSDATVIISESVYDYVGRPVVSFLPAPAFRIGFNSAGTAYSIDSIVRYFDRFNQNNANLPFTRRDVRDTLPDTLICEPTAVGMGSQSGAGLYYHHRTDTVRSHQAYVPHGEGFPYAVTDYLSDGTGRVRLKGGVGKAYQPGREHETKYLYAKPTQSELDALFGTDVGLSKHYLKNAVIDPNGSVSVTYSDMKGHTIATALAGAPPNRLQPLASAYKSHSEDLNAESAEQFDSLLGQSRKSTEFLVTEMTDQVLDYEISARTIKDLCQICPTCRYEIEWRLENACGEDLLSYAQQIGADSLNWSCEPPFQFDSALVFDAATDILTFSNSLELGATVPKPEFALVGWIYFDTLGTPLTLIRKQKNAAGYEVMVNDSGQLIFSQEDELAQRLILKTRTAPFQTGQWHQFVINRSGTRPEAYSFYIDGKRYARDTVLHPDDRLVLDSGSDSLLLSNNLSNDQFLTIGGNNQSFRGRMDDFRFYQRTLSALEASELYNGGCGNRLHRWNDSTYADSLKLYVTFDTLRTETFGMGGTLLFYPNEISTFPDYKGVVTVDDRTVHSTTACDTVSYAQTFYRFRQTLTLPVGTYTTSRTIRVHRPTLEAYVEDYVSKDTCLKTLDAFIAEALDTMSHSGCYNCYLCKELCGDCDSLLPEPQPEAYYLSIPYIRDHLDGWKKVRFSRMAFPDSATADSLIYRAAYAKELHFAQHKYRDILKACAGKKDSCLACNDSSAACPVNDPCESALQQMISHLTPGGQYAYYYGTSKAQQDSMMLKSGKPVVDVSRAYYSILREENQLGNYVHKNQSCQNDTFPKNYKHPAFPYRNAQGNPDTVVLYDPYTGSYTKKLPQELTPEEFVFHWKPSWVYSLLEMHPESCGYKACQLNQISLNYSERMMEVEGYFEARSKGYLNPLKITGITDFPVVDTVVRDFLCGTETSCGCDTLNPHAAESAFIDSLKNYTVGKTSTAYSIWRVAMGIVFCGHTVPPVLHDSLPIEPQVDAVAFSTCLNTLNFNDYAGDTVLLDQFWQTFRGLYLSLKHRHQSTKCDCGGCPGGGGGALSHSPIPPSWYTSKDTFCIQCSDGKWCLFDSMFTDTCDFDTVINKSYPQDFCNCPPCSQVDVCEPRPRRCDACYRCIPCNQRIPPPPVFEQVFHKHGLKHIIPIICDTCGSVCDTCKPPCLTCPCDTCSVPINIPNKLRDNCLNSCNALANTTVAQLVGCLRGLPDSTAKRNALTEAFASACGTCCKDGLSPRGGLPRDSVKAIMIRILGPTALTTSNCDCNPLCVGGLEYCGGGSDDLADGKQTLPDSAACDTFKKYYRSFWNEHVVTGDSSYYSLSESQKANFINYLRGKLRERNLGDIDLVRLRHLWEICGKPKTDDDTSFCCQPRHTPNQPGATGTNHHRKVSGRRKEPCDLTLTQTTDATVSLNGGRTTYTLNANWVNRVVDAKTGDATRDQTPETPTDPDYNLPGTSDPIFTPVTRPGKTVKKVPCGETLSTTSPSGGTIDLNISSPGGQTTIGLADNGSATYAVSVRESDRAVAVSRVSDAGSVSWSYQYTNTFKQTDLQQGGRLAAPLKSTAIALADGSLMIGATARANTNLLQPALLGISTSGEVRLAVRHDYQAFSGYAGYAAVSPAMQGYLATGTVYAKKDTASARLSQALLTYTNPLGTPLWSKTYGLADEDSLLTGLYSRISNRDRIISVAGLGLRDHSAFSELVFLVADGSGAITRQRTIAFRDTAEGNRPQDILPQHLHVIPAHGGGFLITGTLRDTLGGDTLSRAFWAQVDDTLGLRFAYKMNLPGFESQFHSVNVQTDGRGYTAHGVYFNDTTTAPYFLTASFGPEGKMGSLAEPLLPVSLIREVSVSDDFPLIHRVNLNSQRHFSDLTFSDTTAPPPTETELYAEQTAEARTNYNSTFGADIPEPLKKACASCDRITALRAQFEALYSAVSGVDSMIMLANFLNDSLHYQLSSTDYELFLQRCTKDSTLKLCNEALTSPLVIENNCYRSLYDRAVENASEAYRIYIARKKKEFERRYLYRCMDASKTLKERFTRQYQQREYQTTLYYYAQDGSLFRTVPPHAVEKLSRGDSAAVGKARGLFHEGVTNAEKIRVPQHNLSLATDYAYNSLGQLVQSHSPDGDSTRAWYDRLGRMVLTQDQKQRKTGAYEYVFFDGLNRPYESGLINGAALADSLREYNDTLPGQAHLNYNKVEYWVRLFSRQEVVRSYWDNDRFGLGLAVPVMQNNLRRRIASGVYHAGTLDTTNLYNYTHAVHYSYDVHGNADTLVIDEPKLRVPSHPEIGFKKVAYDYDLISGKVNRVSYNEGKADQYFHRYVYDADNRLTEAYSSRNGHLWERDARYFYYLHGPLARTEVGERGVQGSDHIYSLQGWTKGVNSGSLQAHCDAGRDGTTGIHALMARDVYGYTLGYFEEKTGSDTLKDYKPVGLPPDPSQWFEAQMWGSNFGSRGKHLYNGNIARMVTAVDFRKKYLTADSTQGYVYHYDGLNRLVGADPYQNLNKSTNAWADTPGLDSLTFNNGIIDPGSLTRKYQTAYSYDGAGNILNMYRNGGTNVSGSYAMDRFSYTYYNQCNRLNFVKDDTSLTPRYAEDLDNQDSLNYQYDEIGQLKKDGQGGILNIAWNRFNKVTSVRLKNKPTIAYEYDANGNKVYKKIGDKETFYLRDGSGNTLALYEKVSYGDTLVQPFDTTAEQKKWLWELLKPRYLGDTIFEFINEENFGLFFKEECLLPGKTLAGAHAAIHTGLSGLATGLVDSVAAHFDLACVGIAIYDTSFFDWDTSSFTCGIRYKRLIRSEAYLYGSSRLGMDTEEQVIGDSLEKYKAVYNPLCHQWQYLHSLYTLDQIFASIDTSKIRYNEVGWKRYEFGNHLGNVLAVISDRKLLKDTLGGYFLADLYAVQDYDPFGMVQPGRNWKRKDYRYTFNGKEQESTPWLDFDARMYDNRLSIFLSTDPIIHPYQSPYTAFNNNPVYFIDPSGMSSIQTDYHSAATGQRIERVDDGINQVVYVNEKTFANAKADWIKRQTDMVNDHNDSWLNFFDQLPAYKFNGTESDAKAFTGKFLESNPGSFVIQWAEVDDVLASSTNKPIGWNTPHNYDLPGWDYNHDGIQNDLNDHNKCHYLSQKECSQAGFTAPILGSGISLNVSNFLTIVDMMNEELMAGKPMILGVDVINGRYGDGSNPCQGHNPHPCTDHYITLSGAGFDNVGYFFKFRENAMSGLGITSSINKLYLNAFNLSGQTSWYDDKAKVNFFYKGVTEVYSTQKRK